MKKFLFIAISILCLWLASIGAVCLAEEEDINTFHIQEGVIYFVDGVTAEVVDFLKDEETIIIRAEINNLPVTCSRITIFSGLVREIISEKGVAGMEEVYLEDCPNLTRVDIQTVQIAYDDIYDGEDVYLLDCPVLTTFQIHENIENEDVVMNVKYCPNVTVDIPKRTEGASPDEQNTYFYFDGESHRGEQVCIVPEGVLYAVINSADVRSVVLPSTLIRLSMDTPNLAEIALSEANTNLWLTDGVLYSDYELIAYSSEKKDAHYTIEPDVYNFSIQNDYLQKVTLPNDFTGGIGGLAGCPNLTEVELPLTYEHPITLPDDTETQDLDHSYYQYDSRYSKDRFWYRTDGWDNPNVRLTVAEGHESLCVRDGMLYTPDGKELLFAPPNLTGTLAIPEGTKRIAPYALYGTQITTLALPASLEPLSTAVAFLGLSKLESITVSPNNPYFQSIDGVLYTKDGKTMIARPASPGEVYSVRVGTQSIGPYAFLPNESLKIAHLPPSVTHVGWAAFFDNRALTNISLSPSITEIGEYAFENCLQLTKLMLPPGLTSVPPLVGFHEAQEFYWYEDYNPERDNDVALMEIWIPATITDIEDVAFTYTWGLYGRLPRELRIVAEEGSAGEAYAKANGFPYCTPEDVALAREGYRYAILNGSAGETIPVYSAPDDAAAADAFPEGTAVLVLQELGDWIYGRFGKQPVYVKSANCRIVAEQIMPIFAHLKNETSEAVRVFELPSTGAEVISEIPPDTRIDPVFQIGPWFRFSSETMPNGYVLAKDMCLGYQNSFHVQLPAVSALVPVYEAPLDDAKIITMLENGESTHIYHKYISDDGWFYMGSGFVKLEDLE